MNSNCVFPKDIVVVRGMGMESGIGMGKLG
jgi:hypothetical protein